MNAKLATITALCADINAALESAVSANLLAPSSGAFLMGPESSVTEEEAASIIEAGGEVSVHTRIARWREGTRQLTDAGRSQLASEEAAAAAIIEQFNLIRDSDGSGQYGPETGYIAPCLH